MSEESSLAQRLIAFIGASPTPYHAVDQISRRLNMNGFQSLDERSAWQINPGGKYYFARRDASIIAFIAGQKPATECGLRIVGAHTDSPTLKVKPRPEKTSHGYAQLGVEVYGGVLLAPWFDRDLSIAGRVSVMIDGALQHRLINFQRPIAVIPSLAIHLDREANSRGKPINAQTRMRAILSLDDSKTWRETLAEELERQGLAVSSEDIFEYDLNFYDVQQGAVLGLKDEFICSARLDNQLSCFAGLEAFLNTSHEEQDHSRVIAFFDHEEVGSQSDIGANSNMLSVFLERLAPAADDRHIMAANSLLLSVDNAHGIHPNFPEKHDENHGPLLNHGPVIKFDVNQSYATSSGSSGVIHLLAKEAIVPVQAFTTRADMRCGSTIGPMSAANTGINTVDLGVPTFAMHSIREMAGANDLKYLEAILCGFMKMGSMSLL